MPFSRLMLILSGISSFIVAIFQAVITFSPEWSLYFGAPEMLVSNRPALYLSGLTAAVVFLVFGLYALSGAGIIRSLPFLRLGLPAVGCIYTLRGLVLVPQLLIAAGLIPSSEPIPIQAPLSSLVALVIGCLYLAGIIGLWINSRKGRETA